MKPPRVTVLMPVYNVKPYIDEAVSSILCQSFSDLELLIIDDCSSDGTFEKVRSFSDKRIKLVRNDSNMGVAATLNRGLSLANGEYIARMDGDDICRYDRLGIQVDFMDRNPDVGICGGWVRYYGSGVPSVHRVPSDMQSILPFMLFDTPMCHVTVMMRRSMIVESGLAYDANFTRSEDYELWSRACKCFKMANIPSVFVDVRLHCKSVTQGNLAEMTKQVEQIQKRLLGLLSMSPSQEELSFHLKVGRGYRLSDYVELIRAEAWLSTLLEKNKNVAAFNDEKFRAIVGKIWFRACANSTPIGFEVWRRWMDSPLSVGYAENFSRKAVFILSLLWHRIRGK